MAMDKEEIKVRLRAAVQEDPYCHEIKSVALFGSHVLGTARADSDVDVLIDFDSRAAIGLFEFVEIQERLSQAVGIRVDLLTPQSLSKYFRDDVLEAAEAVYGA